MGRFTRISEDAFNSLQVEAGVILTTFDPYHPYRTPESDEILATTTGGVSPSCVADSQDYGSDVDNVPNNMMELKQITGYTCSLSFTSIKFNAANTKWALGAADITTLSNGVKKIKPRKELKLSDFQTIWWVGDKADGGAYAIKIYNALSTAGLSIKTSKNGKGTMTQTITAHTSVNAQDDVAMEFYDIPPEDVAAQAKITQTLDENTTSTITDTYVDIGDPLTGTLAAGAGYTLDEVHILMGGTDITADVYDDSTGGVSIAAVTADIDIIATSKEE